MNFKRLLTKTDNEEVLCRLSAPNLNVEFVKCRKNLTFYPPNTQLLFLLIKIIRDIPFLNMLLRFFGYFYLYTMNVDYMLNNLLQIEIVGPEGYKLKWMLLVLAVLVALYLLIRKAPSISSFIKPSELNFRVKKNKIYHPSTLSFEIENCGEKATIIQHPIIRFKKGRNTKAYKIGAVNASKIYPLYLEKGKMHQLSISLQPFYDFNTDLIKFNQVRVECSFDNSNMKKSRYLVLFPTLFKKHKS